MNTEPTKRQLADAQTANPIIQQAISDEAARKSVSHFEIVAHGSHGVSALTLKTMTGSKSAGNLHEAIQIITTGRFDKLNALKKQIGRNYTDTLSQLSWERMVYAS